MSSSVHMNNENKDISILSEGQTQELDDTTLMVEVKYPSKFTQSGRRFVSLSQHFFGCNSFQFVNVTKIYQFKSKNSKILQLMIWEKKD